MTDLENEELRLLREEVERLKAENKKINERLENVLIYQEEKTARWIIGLAKSNLGFWRWSRRVMRSEKCSSDVENQTLSNETGFRTYKRVLRFDVPKTRVQVLKPVPLERA